MTIVAKQDLIAASHIVYEHMNPTPQIHWPLLSQRCGCDVWVKHENHTPIGAFKVRGGLNYMTKLRAGQPCITGVISATRGNHGQSLALAASKVGLKAVVVVPKGNNPEKNAAMRAFGAELIEHGEDFQESYDHAINLAFTEGLHPIRAFHADLVAGVGTYGMELFEAVPELDEVYVAVGQGSGICGLMSARKALGAKTRIVGVVSEAADCYARSFEAGEMISTDSANTIADGVACRIPDEAALESILDGVARMVRVSDDEIMAAMAHLFTDTHNLAEGAGAAPLAALLKEKDQMTGKKVGLILSGGNVDRMLMAKVLNG
ncbi:threonine dehydratase [Magnetospira sp. QH-2]|uniref:threonine dehydratase n=1 Tax=Magnetospira sp. (strain QH-2) TaxID=1288970 RepID=UPI0003E8198C|nr:threonine dehydratase [Magnetospira sp. QH-2]CCQ73329.1 Threonine dehydratase (Threonine ammonia-lyase) [Magnetospira sp. QH-2]